MKQADARQTVKQAEKPTRLKVKVLGIRIAEEELERLRALAAEQEVSVGSLVRKALKALR